MTNPKSPSLPLIEQNNLSEEDKVAIGALSRLAQELTGVQLSERHQMMVASRLNKRLTDLGLGSLSEYLNYFNSNRITEIPKLVGLLTTHHTYFFREFSHFEYLERSVFPTLLPELKNRKDKKIKIWVAACSRGQESYSLAMYLDHHLKKIDPSFTFEIFGTDVDPESVAIASNGVYLRSELKEAPMIYLADHWAKGTGEIQDYVKAKKSLRDKCKFQTGNLLDLKSNSAPHDKFDIIFCRNVFIYFNPDQIKKITNELLARLTPAGHFFIGISESLNGLTLPVASVSPSVYQHKAYRDSLLKKAPAPSTSSGTASASSAKPAAIVKESKITRVVCVDDSPSILTLLKQILSKAAGFEIVATAKNGLEAAIEIQKHKPDVVTLDIHMPEQNGIEYLEKNLKSGHPPVVMVTSVSRDNAELAGKALSLGAVDYVEKPALSNLSARGDEIRNKVRCALLVGSTQRDLTLDKSFQTKPIIKDANDKIRIIVMPLSARSKLKFLFNDLTGKQPPTILLVEGASDALAAVAPQISKEISKTVSYSSEAPKELKADSVTLLDFSSNISGLKDGIAKNRKVSIMVYGDLTKTSAEKLLAFQNSQLLLEDLGSGKGAEALMEVASDITPHTSFGYLSLEFFSQTEQKKAA